MIYKLDDRQEKAFMKIRSNTYGEGGAFFGMCMNQAMEYNLDFEVILKKNLTIQANVEDTFGAVKAKIEEGVVVAHKKVKE